MAKDPAFLFYSSDFLSGCSNLTFEERGQYITLLCLQHQQGHLSKKIIDINIPNISEDVLSKFSIDKEGKYFNKRLDEEIAKRKEHANKQRENVNKRWEEYRRKKYQNDTKVIPPYIPNEYQSTYQNDTKIIPLENEDENENINGNINNNLFNFIEDEFGRTLSPSEYEVITEWENNDLTRYAVKQAILNGAPRIKYIQTILNSYKVKNIKSVQEAQLDEENFKKKKNKSIEPEWVGKEITEEKLSEEEHKKVQDLLKEFK